MLRVQILRSSLNTCLIFSLALSMFGCNVSTLNIEPNIAIKPIKADLAKTPSAFAPLTLQEMKSDWGREMIIARRFAKDLDLYRAITTFKRALYIIPADKMERRLQIEYSIVECYYLAAKYCDAIQEFEGSSLPTVPCQFPAFRNLLIIMQECYDKMNEFEKSEQLLKVIEKGDSELANDIQLSIALSEGDVCSAKSLASFSKKEIPVNDFLNQYCCMSLSPKKAKILNAVLPGAGYYYVGQSRAASTSFILNSLFIAATYYFIDSGNWPAGLITLSLETGWYIGGINGAGLEAKEYNEKLYTNMGKGMMIRNDLFPALMLETSF